MPKEEIQRIDSLNANSFWQDKLIGTKNQETLGGEIITILDGNFMKLNIFMAITEVMHVLKILSLADISLRSNLKINANSRSPVSCSTIAVTLNLNASKLNLQNKNQAFS